MEYDRTDDDGLLSDAIIRIVREVTEGLDDHRLSAIRSDQDGILQVVDDILTKAKAANLSLEDAHRAIALVTKGCQM